MQYKHQWPPLTAAVQSQWPQFYMQNVKLWANDRSGKARLVNAFSYVPSATGAQSSSHALKICSPTIIIR